MFLRGVGNMGSRLGPHALRIAVKEATTNRRIVEVLRSVVHCTDARAVDLRGSGTPIVLIFVSTIVGAIVARRKRDRCLKLFDDYHLTTAMADGQVIWGDLLTRFQSGPVYVETDASGRFRFPSREGRVYDVLVEGDVQDDGADLVELEQGGIRAGQKSLVFRLQKHGGAR